MIIGMLVLLFFVQEQDTSIKLKGEANAYADDKARRLAEKQAKKEKAKRKAMKLTKSERKSLLFMPCLFFLFCGTNAITTFFSFCTRNLTYGYCKSYLADDNICIGIRISAIPAGKLGKNFGRKDYSYRSCYFS